MNKEKTKLIEKVKKHQNHRRKKVLALSYKGELNHKYQAYCVGGEILWFNKKELDRYKILSTEYKPVDESYLDKMLERKNVSWLIEKIKVAQGHRRKVASGVGNNHEAIVIDGEILWFTKAEAAHYNDPIKNPPPQFVIGDWDMGLLYTRLNNPFCPINPLAI